MKSKIRIFGYTKEKILLINFIRKYTGYTLKKCIDLTEYLMINKNNFIDIEINNDEMIDAINDFQNIGLKIYQIKN